MTQLVTTRRGAGLIFYGFLLGFIFAFTALAISVVAFPLLLDRPASAATAVAVSIRAVTSNLMVMLVWGLIVVVLLVAGAIVFLIGLAAVLPILGHATWHLYRKVVVDETCFDLLGHWFAGSNPNQVLARPVLRRSLL